MDVYEDSYLPDILHGIAQGLLVPTMVIIIVLILGVLFLLGWWVAEFVTERRHYRQNMPQIINEMDEAQYDNISDIITKSSLLRFQKAALLTVSRNMGLGEEALFSLAQTQIAYIEGKYNRRLAIPDTVSKIAPMLGLMGTLIPLGPGIVALGHNDVQALSNALLLAFDATVCGLACAIVCLIVSRVKKGWYGEYIGTLESLMGIVIDRAASARAEGVELPANYIEDPLVEFKNQDKALREKREAEKKDE